MPTPKLDKMTRELKKSAKRKGLTGKRKRKYVYGRLRKEGWKPPKERNKRKGKGKR